MRSLLPRCALHSPVLSLRPQVRAMPASYMRALGVYFPIYLVPALLVHR